MMPDAQTQEFMTAARLEPIEVIRLGKDELNLAEFPITLLADRVPKDKKTIQYQDTIFDEKTGKHITRKLTISAVEAHGLPTAVDDDVILGLIQLTKMVNNFASREVEFSRLDLIRLLGWPDSGVSYSRLTKSLKRWLSVTLLYENAWRDNSKGIWTTKGFHILDNIELNDTRMSNAQGELFPSKIIWNKVVFESFAAGYLKTIDYGLYLSLKHSVSRRMYRFLSKRMYFGPELTFDLRDFAFAHIGLSDSYGNNAGKIKEKLQPGLAELEEVGFLEPLGKEARYQKVGKGWQIHVVAKSKPPSLPGGSTTPASPPLLVAQLISRGVTPKTAEAIVQQHTAEVIELKIDLLDWLMEKRDKRIGKNPAGWLVKAIADDFTAPSDYVSKPQRERQAEAKRQNEQKASEKRQREHAEAAAEKAERQMIDAQWASLSSVEQVAWQAEADALVPPEQRASETGPFKKMGQQIRRTDYIRQRLRDQGKLPPPKA